MQFNLPFSKQSGDIYWHWNAGLTWLPQAELDTNSDDTASLELPFLAGSAIYRLRPMFHLMTESVITFAETRIPGGTERETLFTVSPGVRGGWNLGDKQLILGFAVPVTWGGGETEPGAFVYFSYELPFKK